MRHAPDGVVCATETELLSMVADDVSACGLVHMQADAFRDENSKRRTLEKQMDSLCQQVHVLNC